MKNLLNIIFLSPILVYLILLLLNSNLLSKKETVNIFWIFQPELPIITIISVFFIAYIFLLYFSEKFSSFFAWNKNKKLQDEILNLKAKLADEREKLIEDLRKEFLNNLESFKEISNKNLELSKKETSKVLWNLEFEIQTLKEKIEKLDK